MQSIVDEILGQYEPMLSELMEEGMYYLLAYGIIPPLGDEILNQLEDMRLQAVDTSYVD